LPSNESKEQYLFVHVPSVPDIVIWGTDNPPFRI